MYDTSTVAARLVALNGEAWAWEGNDRLPLSAGSLIHAGQLLETGIHGSAQLLLSSGHELSLGANQSLLLDADVLADAGADLSEWTLASNADPALLAEYMNPTIPVLSLEAVLDASSADLDSLLGASPATAGGGASPAVPDSSFADADMVSLLRSLYGLESGHQG